MHERTQSSTHASTYNLQCEDGEKRNAIIGTCKVAGARNIRRGTCKVSLFSAIAVLSKKKGGRGKGERMAIRNILALLGFFTLVQCSSSALKLSTCG